WHLLLARQAQAQRAQVFPQWLVLKLDRRRVALRLDALAPLTAIAAIAAQMQALLAAQQGAAGLAQAQAAMTGHIDLGVAKRDQLAQDGAPFLLAQLVGADGKRGQALMAQALAALAALAAQMIDNIAHAKALPGPINRGQGHARGARGIPGHGRLQAGVAVAAGLF